ncbi:MAG: rhodanese-like domain-containing protein [Rhodocyclaceae bacterium]|nr:rhodanese-like domain-containing protein [Rhodocyclaceae bacterium]
MDIVAFLQQNVFLVILVIASGAMLVWSFISPGAQAGISVADATLKLNRDDAIVLDVRESGEWTAGHIPNARHIALGQLEKRMSELEKFKQRAIIICCATGNRSGSACGMLKKAGFEQVFNLNGGIGAWKDAGLPTTTKG